MHWHSPPGASLLVVVALGGTLACWVRARHPFNYFHPMISFPSLADDLASHLWATSEIVPCSEVFESPRQQGVATPPPRGPLLILSATLKCWGPPKGKARCSHHAHPLGHL